jgi:hypothetical protein
MILLFHYVRRHVFSCSIFCLLLSCLGAADRCAGQGGGDDLLSLVAETNRHYQDLHVVAGNVVRVLSPPAPMGTTLADRLCTVPPWVMELATYYIRLGATLAMAVT